MDIRQEMILLKGKPKTMEIASVSKGEKGVNWVRFKSGKSYPYSDNDIHVLTNPKETDVTTCRISNKAGKEFNPVHIWKYSRHFHAYYRIEFQNGSLREYDSSYLNISHSVLADKAALNIFNYLKEVSSARQMKTENGSISLQHYYDKVSFIEDKTALASYLSSKMTISDKHDDPLIYPFYSNLSQMDAVEKAFNSQISVIQGPPGTGKTQTILNIIANIIIHQQTVLVVSNNNSAVENIKEKLDQEGLGFIVAQLGSSEKRKTFIESGQTPYPDMSGWADGQAKETVKETDEVSAKLRTVFEKQNRLAELRQESSELRLEAEHFRKENHCDINLPEPGKARSSEQMVKLWIQLETMEESAADMSRSLWKRIRQYVRKRLLSYRLGKTLDKDIDLKDTETILTALKTLFYKRRQQEMEEEMSALSDWLKDKQADRLLNRQAALSMRTLKASLYNSYKGRGDDKGTRTRFTEEDLLKHGDLVAAEYPLILSTTYSATASLPRHDFDYLIMDEASQVPVESGALSLLRARNAVIAGDLQQLPNILDEEQREKIAEVNGKYHIAAPYNCLHNSFLSSVVSLFPDAPQTLLREHYRCAPMIINYCNQKFYDGKLILMTHADTDEAPMKVIRTVKGQLSRCIKKGGHVEIFNQREVDELKQILKSHPEVPLDHVGVITPYKGQADLFHQAITDQRLEADTIHKYQGREKDIIVMSTAADWFNDFVNDPHLINVAVSRAKKKFLLITNGNDNTQDGNLPDLINYIKYHNGTVVNSSLHSVFDLLYSCYARQREAYLRNKRHVSEYDSENIAYQVIRAVLKRGEWSYLDVIPHYHLSALIRDFLLLTHEERLFAKASWSHVDFLIENQVTRQPVLAIEVDGFAYHHQGTRQAERDRMKDSILRKYNIPLLRLSTTGSDEVATLEKTLAELLPIHKTDNDPQAQPSEESPST